ncbi:hypothetical protein DCCM_0773 [Desulfocucumis palustris]|uniref:Uncharacterized protein n=1 Tax=Desulfocucumis palustris TaxID=1898651 RepID=A0A2L2X8M7_9FIRM|nr:hypothetical protein [Desulfocucumis palustris]GBF32577.1 hypothetical protein DCCM_0773 [Desulfocucumis palustris]
MEYIWIIALLYIIFKAVSRVGRRDFPGGRLPEPGSKGERPPASDTGDNYSGLPRPGREPAGADSDTPLPGPWWKSGGEPPAPVEDDYVAGPWGRGPQPRREDHNPMDTKPDAPRPSGESPDKQPEEPPEPRVARETSRERGKPREISGPPPRDGGRERAGRRAPAERTYAGTCEAGDSREIRQKDETVPESRQASEYRGGKLNKLFTPRNIGYGIILAELLGPRGGRGRRRR